MTDLNYLYHRHQVSLVRADRASCSASRASHRGLATGYALRIERMRADEPGTGPARMRVSARG